MKRLALCVLSVLTTAGAGYAQFTFTSIDYPGGQLTTARGINNRGDIVGSYRVQYPRHAVLIRGDAFIPLAPETVLGSMWSEAFKSNDRGDVVGYYGPAFEDYAYGFLLRQDVVTTLVFPGAYNTYAFGINDRGTVVGGYEILNNAGALVWNTFLWNNGEFSEVRFPEDWENPSILGINNHGEFVGCYSTAASPEYTHGFVFRKGQFVSFDVPFADTRFTQANAINEQGHIVGTYGKSANPPLRGFLWTGTAFTSIDYPDAWQTTAWGINAAGQISGKHWDSEGSLPRGFLAQPDR